MFDDYQDPCSLDLTTTAISRSIPSSANAHVITHSLEELNAQLNSLLSLVKTHKKPCICPSLEPADEALVALSVTSRSYVCSDSSHYQDIQSIPIHTPIHVSSKGKRKHKIPTKSLYEGWSNSLNRPIDIAITRFPSLFACNSVLQDAFISAGLQHENVCEVTAVSLYPARGNSVKIRVERETTRRSLEADLIERRQFQSFYAEIALMSILGQICAVLIYAEEYVSGM